MKLLDKIFSVISIPIGGFLIIISLIGSFTEIHFTIALSPITGLILFIIGWNLCVTLARAWRMSRDYENLRLRDVLDTPKFREFLQQHPEFIELEARLQNRIYENWSKQPDANVPMLSMEQDGRGKR
jgi:hypothetical protein